MPSSLQFWKHLVQQGDFSRTANDLIIDVVALWAEQHRMVADLPKLHYNIVQSPTDRLCLLNEGVVQKVVTLDGLDTDLLVKLLLPRRQVAPKNFFHLFRKLIQNLQSAKASRVRKQLQGAATESTNLHYN